MLLATTVEGGISFQRYDCNPTWNSKKKERRAMTSRGQQGANKASICQKGNRLLFALEGPTWAFWLISTISEHSPPLQQHVCHQKRSPPRLQNINPRCSEERMRWSCGPGGRCGEWTHRRPDSGLLNTYNFSVLQTNFGTGELYGYAVLTQGLWASD